MLPNAIDLTIVANVKSWLSSNGTPPNTTTDDGNIQGCISAFSSMFLWRTGQDQQDGTPALLSPYIQQVTYNETYDGNGSFRLFLRHRPIRSVSSLVVGNRTYAQSTGWGNSGFVIDATAASISLRGGSGASFFTTDVGCGAGFFEAPQNVAVVYVAGMGVGAISSVALANGGAGYADNDTFTINGGTVLATGTVLTVSAGVVLTFTLNTLGQGYSNATQGVPTTATTGAGTGLTLNLTLLPLDADIELAARKSAALNYKRKSWVGLRNVSMGQGAGSTSYQDWELDPDTERLIANYSRWAIV